MPDASGKFRGISVPALPWGDAEDREQALNEHVEDEMYLAFVAGHDSLTPWCDSADHLTGNQLKAAFRDWLDNRGR